MNVEEPRPDRTRSDAPTTEAPIAEAARPGRFRRIPLWLRIAVPVALMVIAAVIAAAVIAGIVAAGSSQPADADSLCRSAATAQLERRGHTEVQVGSTLDETEADGALRLSGTVTFIDEDGATHTALVRCVVRGEGDAMRVASVRFFD
ncbi:hypothetical protein [Agromyces sp. ZXT2-3]|uniref:hypothetical protein n=1 Tax=Agromyces sp. ZXT2-3 TaxID=3461152 RepID=UPI004054CADF